MQRGKRGRSVTSLSGGAVLAGTRTLKDWNLASDIYKRADRFNRWHEKRSAAWGTEYYSGVSQAGPVVRTPIFKWKSDEDKSVEWHQQLVKATFDSMSTSPAGEIGIDQLETSFKQMKIPIDEATFARYAAELVPQGNDSVNFQEFDSFHKAVWANQPASVRRFAGDPSTGGNALPFLPSDSVRSAKQLSRSSSVPSGGSLQELRQNENMLRSAFKRYERTPGYIDRSELPSLFQDVGLDLGINSELGLSGSFRLNNFLNTQEKAKEKIPLHDLVELQNGFISTLEAAKSDRTPRKLVHVSSNFDAAIQEAKETKLKRRDLANALDKIREAQLNQKVEIVDKIRGLVAEADAVVPPDSPGAARQRQMQRKAEAKDRARDALQAALFDEEEDEEAREEAKEKARNALQAALYDEDDAREDAKEKARDALQAALYDEDDAREDAKEKARDALQAALYDEDDAREDAKEKARDALQSALFGEEDAAREDAKEKARNALQAALYDEDDAREDAKEKARDALQAALFDEEDEEAREAAKERARNALQAALYDEDDAREDAKEKARDALQAALFEEENGKEEGGNDQEIKEEEKGKEEV